MTKIEWTDATWNPVTGCTKVSQGCKNCYAERLAPKVFAGQRVAMFDEPERPRRFTDVWCHPERLDAPLHWRKPRRVFVNSMSDLFHEDVPFDFIDRVFGVMARAPHMFQILTKRPARMRQYMAESDLEDRITELWREDDPDRESWSLMLPLRNVWLGVSVEDQYTADLRIPLLLQTQAAVRFISAEPLLGPVNLRRINIGSVGWHDALAGWRDNCPPYPGREETIDWVIAGGESGPNARPSHPDWFRSLRDQCATAFVPFFFKQWGEWVKCETEARSDGLGRSVWPDDEAIELADGRHYRTTTEHGAEFVRVGKKAAGRMLDGRTWNEYPEAAA